MLDNIAPHRMGALIEAGRLIVSDLDLDSILQRVVETAGELTGARYVALGVLDGERHELERFITHGIDEATQRQIGTLPRGRGVLGVLIEDPRPLRLAAVADHPASYGFPPHHPPMGSFLGVPILIRGKAWGNLYLTEKADGGAFDDADEAAVVVLSALGGDRRRQRAPVPARFSVQLDGLAGVAGDRRCGRRRDRPRPGAGADRPARPGPGQRARGRDSSCAKATTSSSRQAPATRGPATGRGSRSTARRRAR